MRILHGLKGFNIRNSSVGLLGMLVVSCGLYQKADYPSNITIEGTLKCCKNLLEEEVPDQTSFGWFVELDSPIKFGRQSVQSMEVFPVYQFQIDELVRFDEKKVRVVGFLTRGYVAERKEWIFGVKMISIDDQLGGPSKKQHASPGLPN